MRVSPVNRTKSVCSTNQERESPTKSLPDIFVCREASKTILFRLERDFMNMGKFLTD